VELQGRFTNPVSKNIHITKYRTNGESFRDSTARVADSTTDSPWHFEAYKGILRAFRFLPGGRVQSAMGAPRTVTPYNCFVCKTVEDSMESIMSAATYAADTMRLGGGIGYDFSRIRPRGDLITTLDSQASGPVSYMRIFDAVCQTISSSGHRRGAQMAVLRVDHPDIEEFIHCKQNSTYLTAFNISVGITDAFMRSLAENEEFPLTFGGKVYKRVSARKLWDDIMRSTWDWAEPGVLFIDRINRENNLHYCETIEATNPCGEQPLPPNGACLLGSFNLTQYLSWDSESATYSFDWRLFRQDIPIVIRAMDNVIDRAVYPKPEQREEALAKRRMGIGVTGLANALEAMGHPYGSRGFLLQMDDILRVLCHESYFASVNLAKDKGAFPLFKADQYLQSKFIQEKLPEYIKERIRRYGIRNSHLMSIAPTGTISLAANNVSSGVEPVFSVRQERTIQTFDGPEVHLLEDYGKAVLGVNPKTANEVTAHEHVEVLCTAQKWMDSAVSKTCNVGDDVSWEDFKNLYILAYNGGAKGCTTFRASGKRMGILKAKDTEDSEVALACAYDPETGTRSCDG